MAIKASAIGLEVVDRARQLKGWNKTGVPWQVAADVSRSTLDRFWMQKPIKQQNFVAICVAVGVTDWQQVADLPPIESVTRWRDSNLTRVDEPVTIRRGENLIRVNDPVIAELEGFSQQIFDWFGALSFEFEGLPRREGNYTEWVIRVPVRRSRFDRVLIRAIIHEVGLSDLDGLRRSVADLRVDEGWLITSLWVSPLVQQVLNKSEEGLTCLTFDELIDQDADFVPYVAWLEAEIRRQEMEKYYVPLGCTRGEFDGSTQSLRGISSYSATEGGIDLYIDRWLENPMNEHVSILGEFGTGKTWFVLHYAGRCLRAYLEAKRKGLPRPRLPLVIPLRDYAKALNVENVLAGFFYTQHNIRLNSAVFDRLNQMGKLLLIFDGFDEMAEKVDPQKMINNFWELAKVVTPNAKVILTCRTEHFPTAQVGRDTLRGELKASTANLTGVPPQFETLELMKFDDAQIREVLGRRTNELTVEKMMGNGQVLDLLRRAVMAEFVLAALPEIEAGAEIDLARVYLYAVRRQMEENITTGRTFTSLADKLYFLCELSWEMLSTDRMSLNYREFPDLLKKFFGAEVESQKDLDHWHYDMMGQTMLVRNDDGDYSPAHRSLLEFFVAYKFAAELGLLAPDFLEMAQAKSGINEILESQLHTWSSYWQRDTDQDRKKESAKRLKEFTIESTLKLRNTFGQKVLTKAVLDLLISILSQRENDRGLLDLIHATKEQSAEDSGYLGGNAATVLVHLDAYALDYQDLSNANLTYANLVNAGLRKTILSGANLENSLTTKVFGSVHDIVISKDEQYFITAHDDSFIRIWDRNSGREIQKLTGHEDWVRVIILSKDGNLLYSGSDDRTIREWRLADGECQKIFHGHQSLVRTLALSEDNQLLYSGSDDCTIREWRLLDGNCQKTFKGHQSLVRTITLSKDEHFLYSGSRDGTIKEWDLSNNICQRTINAHQSSVRTITLSKDGHFLYSGSRDGTIKEWDLSNNICQRTINAHQSSVREIILSSNEELLYSSSDDRTIKEWQMSNGICQRIFEGHQSLVNVIVMSKDEKFIYSGSNDRTIKVWDLSLGICCQTVEGHQNLVRSIILSKDEHLLYSGGGDSTIKEWNIDHLICQRVFKGHKDSISAMAIDRNGQLLYSGSNDCTIREWNLVDGVCQYTFTGHQDEVSAISLSNDGKSLYSGSGDRMIKEWSLSSYSCQQNFQGHESWVNTLAISSDGQLLYSGSLNDKIKEWKILDGSCQCTFQGRQSLVRSIALSRDSKLLYSGGGNGVIKEWNLSSHSCQQTFQGHEDWVIALTISTDGNFLYSGGDKTIKKWSLADYSCQNIFKGHQDWVMTIVLSEDGEFLYSGSGDGTIKIWHTSTGECLHTIDQRLCAGANITGAKGLTPAQTDSLIALGAFDDNRK
jgi:WD40 repeat protein